MSTRAADAAITPADALGAQRRADLAATFERLQMLRFPLAVSVVLFHNHLPALVGAPGAAARAEGWNSQWVLALHALLSQGLSGIRMPLFFAISGYVFYLGGRAGGGWLRPKLMRRVRSVLVPLVAWNALLLIAVAAIQALPGTEHWLLRSEGTWGREVADFGIADLLDALLGWRNGKPFVYPLWFLRDLLLMFAAAPLFLALSPPARLALVACLLGAWSIDAWPWHWPSLDAVCFFHLGALAALDGQALGRLDAHRPQVLGAALALLLARALVPGGAEVPQALVRHGLQVAGMLLLLLGTTALLRHAVLRRGLRAGAQVSFFIFVGHEPLLSAVRRALCTVWPPAHPGAAMIVYLASTVLTVCILIIAMRLAQRLAPGVLGVLNGCEVAQLLAGSQAERGATSRQSGPAA